MGTGRSKAGGVAKPTGTPSGYTYDDFMKMNVIQRMDIITKIVDDDSIKVPDDYIVGEYDNLSKVMYALGMDGKPTLVDDDEFDAMPGKTWYRTVNGDTNAFLPFTGSDVIDSITNDDYTRMSGDGNSAYGRGLYFSDSLSGSLAYGWDYNTGRVMRVKASKDAKIGMGNKVKKELGKDYQWNNKQGYTDGMPLTALAMGYDGYWNYAGGGEKYLVMFNRKKFTAAKKHKSINTKPGATKWNAGWNDLED